jgi:RNA-binding protein
MKKSELKKLGTELKPTIQIGKTGITDNIKKEISYQLEKRELVKIKFLKSMGPSSYWKGEIEEIASSLKAELVEVKGGTVLIYKRSSKKKGTHSNSSSK